MRYHKSAFNTDVLELSKWDLLKLFFGNEIKVSGMIITPLKDRIDIINDIKNKYEVDL